MNTTELQTRIDSLPESGGIVRLEPGDVVLDAPARLGNNTLIEGSGRGTRLIVSRSNTKGTAIVAASVRGAAVAKLSVEPEDPGTGVAGIVFDDVGDCRVRDVLVRRFGSYGIWLRNNSFLCEVTGCTLAGNRAANLLLDHLADGGRIGDYVPNLVTNCMAYGGDYGFVCDRAIVVNFVGCQAFQVEKAGFRIHSTSNSVLLSGCRTFKMVGDAVRVERSHEINITGNIFCWHRGTGIVLEDVSWGTISGNNVIDSGSECAGGPDAVGIRLTGQTRGIQVTGNAVFNWGGQGRLTVGIEETAACSNNGITNNNINYFDDAGVSSRGSGSIAANNIEVKEPAYLGSPDHPDPRFSLESMERFIDE